MRRRTSCNSLGSKRPLRPVHTSAHTFPLLLRLDHHRLPSALCREKNSPVLSRNPKSFTLLPCLADESLGAAFTPPIQEPLSRPSRPFLILTTDLSCKFCSGRFILVVSTAQKLMKNESADEKQASSQTSQISYPTRPLNPTFTACFWPRTTGWFTNALTIHRNDTVPRGSCNDLIACPPNDAEGAGDEPLQRLAFKNLSINLVTALRQINRSHLPCYTPFFLLESLGSSKSTANIVIQLKFSFNLPRSSKTSGLSPCEPYSSMPSSL